MTVLDDEGVSKFRLHTEIRLVLLTNTFWLLDLLTLMSDSWKSS